MSPEEEVGYVEVMVECPFCGAYVPDDFECIKCGAEILESTEDEPHKYVCSECGMEVDELSEECPNCGVNFE